MIVVIVSSLFDTCLNEIIQDKHTDMNDNNPSFESKQWMFFASIDHPPLNFHQSLLNKRSITSFHSMFHKICRHVVKNDFMDSWI